MARFRGERVLATVGAAALLVGGFDAITYAATGGSLILGHTNTADVVTILERTTDGPAASFRVDNPNVAAPFTTNAKGKVVNLFADKAANATLLQGKTLSQVTALAKGDTGPAGPQGLRGLPGVLLTEGWSASTPTLPTVGDSLISGQKATVAVASGQVLVASMSVVLGTISGTATARLAFCVQKEGSIGAGGVPEPPSAPGVWNIPGTSTPNVISVAVSGSPRSFSHSATLTGLTAGTYTVGPCLRTTSGASIENNDIGSGWVQVVNP